MSNWEERKKRLAMFEDTIQVCERREELMQTIENSRENTVLWRNPIGDIAVGDERFDKPCQVRVIESRTLEETRLLCNQFPELRVGVLDFASPVHSGGSVIRGGQGQEESLCRCTTLYPCLDTNFLRTEFYEKNRMCEDGLYSDMCVYIPNVSCVKEDAEEKWLDEQNWYYFDVICSVAPRVRDWKVLEERIEAIFRVAVQHKIDVLVLGAFGCGIFECDVEMAVEIYKKALQKYSYFFRAVYFPMYCTTYNQKNYELFHASLHSNRLIT